VLSARLKSCPCYKTTPWAVTAKPELTNGNRRSFAALKITARGEFEAVVSPRMRNFDESSPACPRQKEMVKG
jgi:hypothetical protein